MLNVEQRDLSSLKKHLVNTDIYGDEVNAEFVESVKTLGILVPLTILPDGTVISGHRRMQAARIAKLKTVPVIVRTDLTDPDEIERALIESNRQREKSNETKAREAQRLLAIEQRAAEKRSRANLKQGDQSPEVKRVTPREKHGDSSNSVRTRDAVGKTVGLSGPSVDAAVQVVEKIDAAKAAGETEKAEHLTETLNKKGIRTALREMRQAEQAEKVTVEPEPVPVEEPPEDKIAAALAQQPRFDTLLRALRNWMREVRELALTPGGIYLDGNKQEELRIKVKNVEAAFSSAKPYAVCPYCMGAGCKACRESGFATEITFMNAPESKRIAALKRKAVSSR